MLGFPTLAKESCKHSLTRSQVFSSIVEPSERNRASTGEDGSCAALHDVESRRSTALAFEVVEELCERGELFAAVPAEAMIDLLFVHRGTQVLVQGSQGVEAPAAEVTFEFTSVPTRITSDKVCVLARLPLELLVGDDAAIVRTIDDLVNGLTIEIGRTGARIGLEMINDTGSGGVRFLTEWAAYATGSVSRTVQVLRHVSLNGEGSGIFHHQPP